MFLVSKGKIWGNHAFFFEFYCFLTRECAHAHERVIAIVGFSLGRSVGWLLGCLVGSVVNFRAYAVNEF